MFKIMGFNVHGKKEDYIPYKNEILGTKGYKRTFPSGTELKIYESWMGNGQDFVREIRKPDGLVYTKYVSNDKFYNGIKLGIKRTYERFGDEISERFEKASVEEIKRVSELYKEALKDLPDVAKQFVKENFTKRGIWKRTW